MRVRESEITRLGELLVADRQTRTQAVRRADWEGGGMTGSHMNQEVLTGQTGAQRGESETGMYAIPSVFSPVACVCLHCRAVLGLSAALFAAFPPYWGKVSVLVLRSVCGLC